ncbi:MAG: potassium transporter TrkG [Planctomycetota bacterium]|nr:potassium transporter TrkG [Planctomycetota bacterium]
MRYSNSRILSVLNLLGRLLQLLGFIMLTPIIMTLIYWGSFDEGVRTLVAFILPAAASFFTGTFLRRRFSDGNLDTPGAMLLCALSWIACSAFGGLPFVTALDASYLDGLFEAVSGFTTTGITVFDGLNEMPRSIIFWRALTQWLGGLGILSFFLFLSYSGVGAHRVLGAESHKISSTRPTPGLYRTVRILWGIYLLITVSAIIALTLEGMPFFDSICHTLTAISTGGFSPYDSSIAYYATAGYENAHMFEYTLTFVMMLGGINFLVHFRVLTGHFTALWDGVEIRYWWYFVFGFVALIILDRYMNAAEVSSFSDVFRTTIFQVLALLSTTGFGTLDIGSDAFPALSKQLFLIMMVIGGCVGSTGGGIKVLRIVILQRLMGREIFKARVSQHASKGLVINKKLVPDD